MVKEEGTAENSIIEPLELAERDQMYKFTGVFYNFAYGFIPITKCIVQNFPSTGSVEEKNRL